MPAPDPDPLHRAPESREESESAESFADSIRARRWLLGTVVSSPDPVLAERLAQWFDFVWIDMEHSALTIRDAQVLAIATKAGGAASLVRVARPDSELLGAVLDAGVDGIVAPRVESGVDAARLVERMRYPPRGSRGFAPRRSTGGNAARNGPAQLSDVACIVQIETQEGLSCLSEIAGTDGVDALVVGTADLSFDLGRPLDMKSPPLVSAVGAVSDAAARSSKAWGVAIGEHPDWLLRLRAHGASLLVFSSDARIYAEAVERCTQKLHRVEHGTDVGPLEVHPVDASIRGDSSVERFSPGGRRA
jgi:2-keto-3-deoxy-L-rhamnonate aldolase RhmA